MAEGQENDITILLGLEGYYVGLVREEDEGVSCPNCGSTGLYGHGSCKLRRVLHSWSDGEKVYLELYCQRWRCWKCGRSFNDGAELRDLIPG